MKSIIVPVDLTHTERLPGMLDMARRIGPEATIVLAHAVEPLPSAYIAEVPTDILEQTKAAAREKLEALSASAGGTVHVELIEGQAANAILELADKLAADAIVIASHKPGWQDFLIGSTAARVVRHAKCTVVVIR